MARQIKKLHLLYWNARSISNKVQELKAFIHKRNIHIIIITETWLRLHSDLYIPGYRIIRNDRLTEGGGVLICINQNLEILEWDAEIRIPGILEGIRITIGQYTIIGIYVSNPNFTYQEWATILEPRNNGLIICGDFNIPQFQNGENWGEQRHPLIKMCKTYGWVLVNTNMSTRLGNFGQRDSAPDLILTSSDLSSVVSCYKHLDTMGSDHFPLSIYINTLTSDWTPILKCRRRGFATPEEIESFMVQRLETHTEQDITYQDLEEVIMECNDNFFPLSQTQSSRHTKPVWWNAGCSKAVASRRLAYTRYRQCSTYANYMLAKQTEAKTKRYLLKCKRAGWKKYCLTLNQDSSLTEIWKKLSWYKNSSKRQSIPEIQGNRQLQDLFLQHISPDSVYITTDIHVTEEIDNDNLTAEIKEEEIQEVLMKKNSSTAPGHDGITYTLIKMMPTIWFIWLAKAYTQILKTGIVPISWKSIVVHPIKKPNTRGLSVTDYRPISLLSTLRKIFEKIIQERLSFYLERNSLWPKSQYGFRKGFSSAFNIYTLLTDIQIAFFTKKQVLALFLDISHAYDSVQLHILIQKLQLLGIPCQILRVILHLMEQRRISLSMSRQNRQSRVSDQGIPQGSSLSPLLYACYVGDLKRTLHSPLNILQYADDIVLYLSIPSRQNGNFFTQFEVECNRILEHLQDLGLNINFNKTKFVKFQRTMKRTQVQVNILNHTIVSVDRITFLGITLQQNLSFKAHMLNVLQKCKSVKNLFQSMAARNWGADALVLFKLIHPLLLSRLEYGILMAPPISIQISKKIESLIYQIYKIIFNINGCPAVRSLQKYFPYFFREDRLKQLGFSFLSKLWMHSANELFPKMQRLLELSNATPTLHLQYSTPLMQCFQEFSRQANIYRTPVFPNFLTPKYSQSMDFPCHIDVITFRNHSHSLQAVWLEYIAQLSQLYPQQELQIIFTDGSKSVGGVSAGIFNWTKKTSQSWKLFPEISSYTAESIAFYMALKEIKNGMLLPSVIFTDCLSVVKAIEKPYSNIQQIYEILVKSMLHQICIKPQVLHIVWIPSHVGIEGNELVDHITKMAIERRFLASNFLVPPSDIAAMKIQSLRTRSQEKLNLRQLTTFLRATRRLPKKAVSIYYRMLFHTAQTPEYLFKIKRNDNNQCKCGLVGSLNHLLFGCQLYTKDQDILCTQIYQHLENGPIHIDNLLPNFSPYICKALFRYTTKTKMKI